MGQWSSWPPWGNAGPPPGEHALNGGPIRTGLTDSLEEAYNDLMDTWDALPGLNDFETGTTYMTFHDPDTGGAFVEQIPAEAMQDLDSFEEWLNDHDYDIDDAGWELYTESLVDDGRYEE